MQDKCPGAQVKRIDLYDYAYTGCVSCFACKRLGGKFYGTCGKRDGITDILGEISEADGILFGSPVYFHDITGQLRCFLERLLFPYLPYEKEYRSIAPKRMPTAVLYTMNVTVEQMEEMGYPGRLSRMEGFIGTIFTEPEIYYSNDTVQFDHYSLYKSDRFSEEDKLRQRREQFPKDCEAAFQIGQRMAEKACRFTEECGKGVPGC